MGVQHPSRQSATLRLPKAIIQDLPQNLGLSRGKHLHYPVNNLKQLVDTASASLVTTGVVNTLYFWGAGAKTIPDKYDAACLEMLGAIRKRMVAAFRQEVKNTLLMSDLHGLANQFPAENILSYYDKLRTRAKSYGFDVVLLSELFTKKEQASLQAPPTTLECTIFNENYERLVVGAAKTGTPHTMDERALRYLLVRLREKQKIEQIFPNHILLNGDRKGNEFLLPDLPMIYIYNTGFRKSHKAWFLTD